MVLTIENMVDLYRKLWSFDLLWKKARYMYYTENCEIFIYYGKYYCTIRKLCNILNNYNLTWYYTANNGTLIYYGKNSRILPKTMKHVFYYGKTIAFYLKLCKFDLLWEKTLVLFQKL